MFYFPENKFNGNHYLFLLPSIKFFFLIYTLPSRNDFLSSSGEANHFFLNYGNVNTEEAKKKLMGITSDGNNDGNGLIF